MASLIGRNENDRTYDPEKGKQGLNWIECRYLGPESRRRKNPGKRPQRRHHREG